MVPNYELFLHGFNAMPIGPEAAPLPVWMKLAFVTVAGLLATVAATVG